MAADPLFYSSESSSPSFTSVRPPFQATPWQAQILAIAFMVSDFFSVVLAYLLAKGLYLTDLFASIRLRPLTGALASDPVDFYTLGGGMAIFLIMIFGWLGLYDRGVSLLNVEEDVLLIRGILVNGVVALAISFLHQGIPRIALGLAILLMAPFLILGRRLLRGIHIWLASAGVGTQPVLIYGAGETGRQLADRMVRNPQLGLQPIGFLDRDATMMDGWVTFGTYEKQRLPILGSGEQLVSVVRFTGARGLFVAIPKLSPDHLMEIQERCRELDIGCYYVPLLGSGPFRRLSLTFVGDIPIAYERIPATRPLYQLMKRIFDVVVASLLLILLSPLFLLVAILIKWASPGPVIFSQERIGRYGKPFRIFKFRTMHCDAPAYAEKPPPGSSRVFPLGRILRKTSIDELPQLINVLRGEMSLVGPRPDMPHIVRQYNAIQRERLIATPGITGLWQISADRNLPIHENMDYDLYYIYNQSMLLDLVILFRTLFCLFSGH